MVMTSSTNHQNDDDLLGVAPSDRRHPPPPPPSRRRRPKSVVETIIDRLSEEDQALLSAWLRNNNNHCHHHHHHHNHPKAAADAAAAEVAHDATTAKDLLIRSLDESCRTLQLKVQIGALGKGDSADCRAAILLQQRISDLSIKTLAKTCGISPKELQLLSNKVANYTDANSRSHHGSVTVTSSITNMTKKRFQPMTTMPVGAPKLSSSSIISTLSIQLGSWIPDSLGFAKRTIRLLDDLQHHIQKSANKHDKKYYLEDIRRKRCVYEAVCFYILLQENQLSTAGMTNGNDGDDDTTTATNIVTKILQAAQVRETEFWSVYEVTKPFCDEIKVIKQHEQSKHGSASSNQLSDTLQERKSKRSKTTAMEPNHQYHHKTAEELLGLTTALSCNTSKDCFPNNNETTAAIETGINHHAPTKQQHSNNKTKKDTLFDQWKICTLHTVLEEHMNATDKNNSNDKKNKKNTARSQALANAANATLILNNIVSL